MVLIWNDFHALKWALLQRHFKLWGKLKHIIPIVGVSAHYRV